MLDLEILFRDVLYVLFGVAALIGVCYSIFTGRKKNIGDETERIVRIDENMKAMREDVADIKAELRQTRDITQNHERRIVVLEQDNTSINKHIEELRKKVF